MSTLYMLGGIMLLLMAALAVAIIIGSLLPEAYQASIERSMNRQPKWIFDLLTSAANHADWRKHVTKVEEETAGRTYRVSYQATPDQRLELLKAEAPNDVLIRVEDVDGPMNWRWSIRIEAEGETGCRVRIEEEGTAAHPWYRFVMRFITGYDKTCRDLMDDLETAAETRDEEAE